MTLIPVTAAEGKVKMKNNNLFRDQVNSITSCFGGWNNCEKIVVLYSLLKQIPPLHCQFLVQMLQQRVGEDKHVRSLEDEANDPGYLCKLAHEPKEKAIQALLSHLPLLHPGNQNAKQEYLHIIPDVLAHALDTGVCIEESRQLLSFSLIHPAITGEERSNFNRWLAHLDESFNYQDNSSKGDESGQGQGHHHGGLQGQNGVTPATQQPGQQNHHVPLSKSVSMVGSERLNGWNNNVHNNHAFQSSESLNMNLNGLDGQGQGHGGSQGNLYSNQQMQQGGGQVHPGMTTSGGHLPLHATLSAPTNFKPMVPPPPAASQHQHPPSQQQPPSFTTPPPAHAPLRRMKSMAPPNSLPIAGSMSVTEWLRSNDDHMGPGGHQVVGGRPASVQSDHAPLSPQSSTASSSGSDTHADDHHPGSMPGSMPVRNTFMEESSGMRDVPLWLKSLRLHKYAYLFQQLNYDEMMNLSDEWLEQQAVTKGARNKIILSIRKLQERQNSLRNLERDIMEGGPIKSCISEMKGILNTPLKTFTKPATSDGGDQQGALNSPGPGPGGDADGNSIPEGDLTGQFTRLMTKVFTQLMLTSPYDDEGLNMFLQLTDKCINHEAFSQKQKKLLDSFKQQARKMWQPAPVKYSFEKKARPNWGNTFPVGTTFNSRPLQRTGLKTPPKPTPTAMWSFGAKRSVVGAGGMAGTGGHMPVQRNNSHSTAIIARQNMMEAVKQPVTRTQSAPLRTPGLLYGSAVPVSTEPPATDTEINARLDSLCRSVTECALGSLDGNERGSAY